MPPRLPLMLRLAEALGICDLGELTGDERLTAASFGESTHENLSEVAEALASHPISGSEEPIDVAGITARVRQGWELWHGSRRHRTTLATILPGLLRDTRTAVRRVDGDERRTLLSAQAQVYHLAQLYLSFQPASELLWLTGDRAMTAAQDADDPHAMAAAAW
ncbi:hypothetical protein [Haloechinothrix sp. LS1_15]|uniref:hypothetical protein n=1 Tax=Haloechinothrix sp. LS1_15 TaxID=2652248 RepID=UPI00294B6281|nr:hypothetical protein [Haloechinothrix sp. LS1_15]